MGELLRSDAVAVAIIRSADGGGSWSAPIIAADQRFAQVSINGQPVRTSDELPEFAVDPGNGNLYAVWQDGRFSATGSAKIAFSMSTNGGLTWSAPIRVDQSAGTAPAFTPQVHVAADGTVGVVYYDLDNATAAQPGLTDAFVVQCHAASADCGTSSNWSIGGQTRVTANSFDMRTAPNAGGFFVGDYIGLTHSGTSFVPFFVAAQPAATKGTTDPFSNIVK